MPARGRQSPRVLLGSSDRQLDPHTRTWFNCADQLCGRRVAMLIATNTMDLAGGWTDAFSIQDGHVIELD